MKKLFSFGVMSLVALASPALKADVVVQPGGEFSTLSAALARVRELRARGELPTNRAAEIAVAPGRYHVTEPLRLTPADSCLRITGRGWDSTVIDGGVEIGPFTEGPDGVWEAKVPAGLAFEQLWVDDQRATRARTPNESRYFYMLDQDDANPSGAFVADPNDIQSLAALSPAEQRNVQVVYWQSWDMGYTALRSVDFTSGRVTTARKGGRKYFFWDKTRPRYVLENYRQALDAPGEWFLDTAAAKLYYKPRPGERLGVTKAYAPIVETVLSIEGDAENCAYVRDVRFTGLGFEFSKLAIGPDGIPNAQSANNVKTAAIEATGADGLQFRNCRIAHTGGHGVWIRGGSVRSALEHTLVEDLGAGGVYFGDGTRELKRLERNSSFLTLHDSIVRHGGRILNGAVGVWLGQVNDCRVVHNEIADFLYTGVSMGWNWGYMPTTTRRNHVDFNHIHHIQQGRLSDGGAFYSLGNQAGSTVCNNWIHDVNGYRDNGSPAWGLYTDEGSAHILLASNLVERCRSGAIHQHYGTENTYANNIFATFDEYGAWRSRSEDHVTIRVMNNIFWWTNPAARAYYTHAKGPSQNLPADGNVYWCAGGALARDAFNFASWQAWRAGGMDLGGAIADPLFVDPSRGDWRLKPDSPALKAGFKPFDWREAGVLKTDAAWVAKAAEETWDVFKDAPKAPPYGRERARVDFERLNPGVLKGTMGSLAPLNDSQGRAGTIEVIDRDVAEGKRALKFIELPNLPRAFVPMVDLKCRIVDGIARLKFAVKGDKTCNANFEARDYDSFADFGTGAVMNLRGETFSAGGKTVCTVPAGTWADVDAAFTLSGPKKGQWTCSVTPRGGTTKTVSLDRFANEKFSHLTWLGFISYGPEGSSWCLDDIRLWKEASPDAPLDPVAFVKAELARGAKTVLIPKARYFITPDGRDETVYFRLQNLRDTTLDFNGAELVGTVRTRMFDLHHCTNVTVRNVSIDFRELPFTQAVIEKVDALRNWDVRIVKGYPRPDMRANDSGLDNHDDFWPIQVYDGRTHELKNPMRFRDGVAIVRTGDDTYRITGGEDRRGEVGDVAVWSVKERGRRVEGENVNAVECADLVFEDIVQYSTPHGRAFIDWSSANTTYQRCKVVRRPPETDLTPRALPRLRSGNHDAFISKNAVVGPKIIDCVAEYHCDDCVNISGAYQVIYEATDNRVRVFVHGLWGLQIGAGDDCQVLTPDGQTPANVRIVAIAEGPAITPAESAYLETIGLWPGIARGMKRSYLLTLDRPVDFPRGTLLASESRMGNGFVIRNCRFGSTRARGLLIKASHGIIENCEVDKAVCFTTEYEWLSAGVARDIVLRNNRFGEKVQFGGRAAHGKPISPSVNTGIVEVRPSP